MDPGKILDRMKSTIWLIPGPGFDSLITDEGYMDSFIYMAVLIALSLPLLIIIESLRASNPMPEVLALILGMILSLPFFYLYALIMHLLLRFVGGQAGYLQTVQIFIYGDTASMLFGAIPLIGIIPALIGLANVAVGSARVHKISIWRAIFAILVIPVLLISLLVLLLVLFVAPGAAKSP